MDEKQYELLINIYKRYHHYLKKRAFSVLNDEGWAEDAVQQTFMAIVRNIHLIEQDDDVNAIKLLSVILMNNCSEIMRKNRKYQLLDEEALSEAISKHILEEDTVTDLLIGDEIMQTVRNMAGIYADTLIMKAILGYSNTEIADIMGVSEATVRKRLERARKKMNS